MFNEGYKNKFAEKVFKKKLPSRRMTTKVLKNRSDSKFSTLMSPLPKSQSKQSVLCKQSTVLSNDKVTSIENSPSKSMSKFSFGRSKKSK